MESELINKSDRKFNNELKTENVSFWYTASSSEAFGRVFNRKLSSLKCPTLDRPAADMNRKVEYMVEISCLTKNFASSCPGDLDMSETSLNSFVPM